jgi:hypothetical protein
MEENTAHLPLSELTENDRKIVDVTDMEEYAVIFFNIEYQILVYWKQHPHMKDKTVLHALITLTRSFDNQKESSLAGRIARAVKEGVHSSRKEGKVYTYGEVISCLKLIKKIVKIHRAPHGRGYLYWVETFFQGRLPETEEEIKNYILKYES